MRHPAILGYPIASTPHCGLLNRWHQLGNQKFHELAVLENSSHMKAKLRKIDVAGERFNWRVVPLTANYVCLRIWAEGCKSKPWAEIRYRFDDPWLHFGEIISCDRKKVQEVRRNLHGGERTLNRTLVIKDRDSKWYANPLPNVSQLFSEGLNYESNSSADFSEFYQP
jgi:hypothetical protein